MKKRRSLYDLSSEKAVGNDSSMNHFHAYISKSTENSVTASSLSTVISSSLFFFTVFLFQKKDHLSKTFIGKFCFRTCR